MTEVTLREFLERKICDLDKRIDQRFIALDKALDLQAKKDEKHFLDLNHEQARIAAAYEKFLPRETYAADRRDRTAMWLASAALIVAILTLIALLPGKI